MREEGSQRACGRWRYIVTTSLAATDAPARLFFCDMEHRHFRMLVVRTDRTRNVFRMLVRRVFFFLRRSTHAWVAVERERISSPTTWSQP